MHPWEFDEYSLTEYIWMRKGRRRARTKHLQEEFQHIRIQSYYAILPYLDKKDKKKTIDKLVPDIYEQPKDQTKLDYKKLIERYKKAGAL